MKALPCGMLATEPAFIPGAPVYAFAEGIAAMKAMTVGNKILLLLVTLAAFATASAARAQVPPGVLITGQVQFAYANNGGTNWCSVKQGASDYQRRVTKAVISLPELTYFNGAYFPLDGQARLIFASATGGTVKFKFWGPTATAPFSGYSETFNGTQYIVSFSIAFLGCTLPIVAGFESP